MSVIGAWILRWTGTAMRIEPIPHSSGWTNAPSSLAALFSDGVFTTMRLAADPVRPVGLALHIDRLASTYTCASITRVNCIENRYGVEAGRIEEGIKYFLATIPIPSQSPWLALTLLLAPLLPPGDSREPALGLCLKPIPAPPTHCAVLALPHAHRSCPHIKGTEWIGERGRLEAMKGQEFNEVLLVDGDRVYEGLSSNFAVISEGGEVVTAPGTVVLAGTVMAMVKEAAAGLGIGVSEACPDIAGIASWQAAFITSTSRLLLPISTLSYNGVEHRLDWNNAILKRLQHALNQRLLSS